MVSTPWAHAQEESLSRSAWYRGGELSPACLWFASLGALLTCLSCFSVAVMRFNDPDSLQKKEFIESMTMVVENVAAGRRDVALEQSLSWSASRERERDREREAKRDIRDTQRESERDTEIETQKETEKQRDTQRGREYGNWGQLKKKWDSCRKFDLGA